MLGQIRKRFGENVARIVEGCSDTLELEKPPWKERKQRYLEHLERQPNSVLLVSLADKLFNARAILRDYLKEGDRTWDRFNVGRECELWYYRALADKFTTLLPGQGARELAAVVKELERLIAADDFSASVETG